jgi:hypothetical protein
MVSVWDVQAAPPDIYDLAPIHSASVLRWQALEQQPIALPPSPEEHFQPGA